MRAHSFPWVMATVSSLVIVCGLASHACADAAPASVQWKLVDERAFNGKKEKASYLPLYVIEADEIGRVNTDKVVRWRHYEDEEEVAYRPEEEFLLDASRVTDRWIELTKQAPHTVRWELVFVAAADSYAVTLSPDGVTVGKDPGGKGIAITPGIEHSLVIERLAGTLEMTVDGDKKRAVEVEQTDRAPIRFTAQIRPVLLRRTKLLFGKDEGLGETPAATPEPQKPEWEVVYKEDFSEQKSIENWIAVPAGTKLEWRDNALLLEPAIGGNSEEVYGLLKMSLPGDIRVSFRARSMTEGQPPFFGIMTFLKGVLEEEDGYFVEWNYWQVQMKKRNARVAGLTKQYRDVSREGGWMQFSMERIGSAITMYTEGEKVLSWTDQHSLNDRDHDLFTFYSWRVPMEYDDVVIERNKLDLVKPNENHPAIPQNYEHGIRHPVSEQEEEMVF